MFSIRGLRDAAHEIHEMFRKKPTISNDTKALLMKSRDDGEAVKQTSQTRGYQILLACLQERFNNLIIELRRSKFDNVAKLQAQLEELEFILDFARKKIEMGETAKESLERLLREEQEESRTDL